MSFSSTGCHVYGSRSLQAIIILIQWLGSAGNVRPVSSILSQEFDVFVYGNLGLCHMEKRQPGESGSGMGDWA